MVALVVYIPIGKTAKNRKILRYVGGDAVVSTTQLECDREYIAYKLDTLNKEIEVYTEILEKSVLLREMYEGQLVQMDEQILEQQKTNYIYG